LARAFLLGLVGLTAAGAGYLQLHAQTGAAPAPRAVLDKYCVTCHNERLKTAGLLLDRLDLGQVGDAATWEKIARKLRTEEMPPPGVARPDEATYRSTAAWFERTLDDAAAARPNPGRVPVHRLNRTEYANAIRDLLALDVDTRALLADEPDQQGFDNVASVLTVSPALLESYLSAAATRSAGWPSRIHRSIPSSTRSRFPPRWCRKTVRATRCRSDRAAGRRSAITSRSTASTGSRSCWRGSCISISSGWASRTRSTSASTAR
jgi:hypothetical protein